MKRLVALMFAMVFAFGSFSPAAAVEVKVSGTWDIGIGWADNTNFTDAGQGERIDAFGAAQRIRTQFEFIASETLKSVLGFEIGTMTWGSNEDGSGASLDADQRDVIGVRRAYLDWSPMDKLSLRIGIQGVALPSAAFGNPVLDTDVAGIVAHYSFTDTVGLTGFWLRPFDNGFGNESTSVRDEMDVFGLTLPISGEGFSVTPWAMYALNGNASGYWGYRADYDGNDFAADYINALNLKGSSNMWWIGTAVEIDLLNPISIKFDGMYGSTSGSGDHGLAPEFSGFLLATLIEYKSGASWGNPGILAWYASGDSADDYKDNKYGRMPIISADRGGFGPTNFGFAGSMGCLQDCLLSGSGVGSWGIGAQLDGFSFMDKLSHTLRFAYIGGTNDKDMVKKTREGLELIGYDTRLGASYRAMGDTVYLTQKDYALEFNLVSTYEATENLTLFLETQYIHLNLDSGTWGRDNADTTDAWKIQFLIEYAF